MTSSGCRMIRQEPLPWADVPPAWPCARLRCLLGNESKEAVTPHRRPPTPLHRVALPLRSYGCALDTKPHTGP